MDRAENEKIEESSLFLYPSSEQYDLLSKQLSKDGRRNLIEMLYTIKKDEMIEERSIKKSKGELGRGRPSGIVYEEVGREIGVTRRSLHHMVEGEYAPSNKTTKKLLKAIEARGYAMDSLKLSVTSDLLLSWSRSTALLVCLGVGLDVFDGYFSKAKTMVKEKLDPIKQGKKLAYEVIKELRLKKPDKALEMLEKIK